MNNLADYASYIGIVLILVAILIRVYERKQLENTRGFIYVEGDPWWKKNRVFLILFRRAFY